MVATMIFPVLISLPTLGDGTPEVPFAPSPSKIAWAPIGLVDTKLLPRNPKNDRPKFGDLPSSNTALLYAGKKIQFLKEASAYHSRKRSCV